MGRIVEACIYVLRGGIPWRSMPHAVPPRQDVYNHLRKWRRKSSWDRIKQVSRERHRVAMGRQPQPISAMIDSQSVKTTKAGVPRGYDDGKKVTGRKRQVLVDTESNLLKTKVHPNYIHDKSRRRLLLTSLHLLFPSILLLSANSSYQGLKSWIHQHLRWTLTLAKHLLTGAQRFHPIIVVEMWGICQSAQRCCAGSASANFDFSSSEPHYAS